MVGEKKVGMVLLHYRLVAWVWGDGSRIEFDSGVLI